MTVWKLASLLQLPLVCIGCVTSGVFPHVDELLALARTSPVLRRDHLDRVWTCSLPSPSYCRTCAQVLDGVGGEGDD